MQSILVFLTSLAFVVFAIPHIIDIAFKKHLFDHPAESRKVHKSVTPNFGGIALYFSVLFTCTLFIPATALPEFNIIIAAGLILFLTGLKDDILTLGPLEKSLAQLLSALLVSIAGNLQIGNLQGLFGFYEIPAAVALPLSVFFIVGVVNAFNLIDGIDGLAGTLASIAMLMFALLFYALGEPGWTWLVLAIAGALLGFLYYNITPAKIFMGDSGALFIGLLVAVCSIKFLNTSDNTLSNLGHFGTNTRFSLVAAIVAVPVFDTLRVLILRVKQAQSPFRADNKHLHHRLLSLGLNHIQSTAILSGFSVLLITLACSLQALGDSLVLPIIVMVSCLGNELLSFISGRHQKLLARKMPAEPLAFAVYEDSASAKGQHVLQNVSEI